MPTSPLGSEGGSKLTGAGSPVTPIVVSTPLTKKTPFRGGLSGKLPPAPVSGVVTVLAPTRADGTILTAVVWLAVAVMVNLMLARMMGDGPDTVSPLGLNAERATTP